MAVLAALLGASCSAGGDDDATPATTEADAGGGTGSAPVEDQEELDPDDDGRFVLSGDFGSAVAENLGAGTDHLIGMTEPSELIDLRQPFALGARRLLAPGGADREFVYVAGFDGSTGLVALQGDLDDPNEMVDLAPVGSTSQLELFWDSETPGALFGTRLSERGAVPGVTFSRFECFRVDGDAREVVVLVDGYDCTFHPSGHAVAVEPAGDDALLAVVSDLDGERTEIDLPPGFGLGEFGLDQAGGLLWVTGELDQPDAAQSRTVLVYDTGSGDLVHQAEPSFAGWEVVATAAEGGVLVSGAVDAPARGTAIALVDPDGTVVSLGELRPAGVEATAAWVAPDRSQSLVLTTVDSTFRGSEIRLATYDDEGTEVTVLHEQASTGTAALDAQLWVVGDAPATVALQVSEGSETVLLTGGADAPLTAVAQGGDVALSSLDDVVADPETGDLLLTYEPGLQADWAGTVLVPADGEVVIVDYDGNDSGGRPTIADLADGEAVVATVEQDFASLHRIDASGPTDLGERTEGVGPLTARGIHLDLEGDVILDTDGGLFRCARSGCDDLEELPGVALVWSQPPDRTARWLVSDGCAPDLIGTGFDQFC